MSTAENISLSEISGNTSSIPPNPEKEGIRNVAEDLQRVLKLNYKEDQWSPLNPNGKKQYDKDFLLQLQFVPLSLQKPSNLPMLMIIRNKPRRPVKLNHWNDYQNPDSKDKENKTKNKKYLDRKVTEEKNKEKRNKNASPIKRMLNHLHEQHCEVPPRTFTPISSLSEERVPFTESVLGSEILTTVSFPEETSVVSTVSSTTANDEEASLLLSSTGNVDQWSSQNLETKNQYDTEFSLLLELESTSLSKPEKLLDVNLVKQKPEKFCRTEYFCERCKAEEESECRNETSAESTEQTLQLMPPSSFLEPSIHHRTRTQSDFEYDNRDFSDLNMNPDSFATGPLNNTKTDLKLSSYVKSQFGRQKHFSVPDVSLQVDASHQAGQILSSVENNIQQCTSAPEHRNASQGETLTNGSICSFMSLITETNNYLKKLENSVIEEDSDKQFLLSLLADLKAMPPEKKLQTKIKFLQILEDKVP